MLCTSVLFKVSQICRKLRSRLNRFKVDRLIKEATNQSICWFLKKSQKPKDSEKRQHVTTKRPSLELRTHLRRTSALTVGEILFGNSLELQCNIEPLTNENLSL